VTPELAYAELVRRSRAETLLSSTLDLLEWDEDLSDGIDPAAAPEFGRGYTLTPIAPLIQAEAVAYLPEGDGVIYTSELARPATEAPLFTQACARR